jgi:hypothetical protein
VVDYVRRWNERTKIPARQFVGWLGIGQSKFHDWKNRVFPASVYESFRGIWYRWLPTHTGVEDGRWISRRRERFLAGRKAFAGKSNGGGKPIRSPIRAILSGRTPPKNQSSHFSTGCEPTTGR